MMTVGDLKRRILVLTNNKPFLFLLPVDNNAKIGKVMETFGTKTFSISYNFS